jgi:hypothetical protein
MTSAADSQSNFPTMIIPRGTEIRTNDRGQLSIRTPGNLVIQNSGTYAELESTNGSIRIEDNVSVEAVSVRCAQACFIQGTLTAWRVHAKKIALEDRAKAYIMLQESETLELSRGSRLVGNFANEKEIYLMLGKFSPQLKQLPGSMDLQTPPSLGDSSRGGYLDSKATPESTEDLPRPLRDALKTLEIEVKRADIDPRSADALREVVFSLQEVDLQRARLIYRDAFSELTFPSPALKSAYELIDNYFRGR